MSRRALPRIPLNKDRVLRGAVVFADDHGVDALTMRKLADELGFGVMSLYNHVANKDEMLDGMVDLVAGEIESHAGQSEWRTELRAIAKSAHDVLMSHPWAAGQWSDRLPGPARLRYMESLLRSLREGGFSSELVYHGYHAVGMHIVGFTLQELSFQFDRESLGKMAARFLGELPVDEFPHFTEHVMAHLSDEDHGDEFGFVLDLILDGLDKATVVSR